MRLEPFSGWPAPWDAEIQKVIELARELGIPKLRVKVKLGTLRIQEGGEALVASVDAADRATQTICPACGGQRARQAGVTLQFCSACEAAGDAGPNVRWIEQLDPESSGPKAVTRIEVEQFEFPTYFTVVSHYEATGEGVTVQILMAYAHNANSLNRLVDEHIESYFSSHAEYFPSLVLPEELRDLVPPKIKGVIDEPNSIRGNLIYFAKYHLNRS